MLGVTCLHVLTIIDGIHRECFIKRGGAEWQVFLQQQKQAGNFLLPACFGADGEI